MALQHLQATPIAATAEQHASPTWAPTQVRDPVDTEGPVNAPSHVEETTYTAQQERLDPLGEKGPPPELSRIQAEIQRSNSSQGE